MKAAICDDNHILLEEMKRIIEQHYLITSVEVFNSPSELIMQINEGKRYDVIFMDLDWGGTDKKTGLQWGEDVYNIAPEVPIIFITGYNDRFAQQVFLSNVNLVGYITKPVDEKILEQYIEKLQCKKENLQHIILSRYGNKTSVDVDEIIYVESKNHKVIVHTETQEYVVYEKLSEVFSRLPKQFVHCHKSFVVNLKWVEKYEAKLFKVKNGLDIAISRTYASRAKEAYFKYLGDMV